MPIFIMGTQRSGTTLLRLILNAHSKIAIPEEARFLVPLLKKRYLKKSIRGDSLIRLIRYLSSNEQFKLWNYDSLGFFRHLSQRNEVSLRELIDLMFSSYCISERKTIWGDKSLFFSVINILSTLFADACFIHIVRDGRDVFDSWRKMDRTKNNAAVVALDWCYKLRKIENSLKRLSPERQLTIRYEDLIGEPEKTIKTVCSFIGVEYETGMLDFYKTSNYYIGSHHSNLIFNPINSENRSKWIKNLSSDEIKAFTFLARRYLEKYNYEMPAKNLSFYDVFGIFTSLAIGIPKRMGQVIYTHRAYEKALKSGQPVESVPTGNMPRDLKKEPLGR
jgi:sulfotransferase family protein